MADPIISSISKINPFSFRAFAFESINVETTPVSLTAATHTPSGGTPAAVATIQVLTFAVRCRLDGTAPTTSEGILLQPGDIITINNLTNITNAKFINAVDASTGVLKVHYGR